VLEKSDYVLVIPTGDIGWSDVGDWSTVSEVLETDEAGNLIRAPHIGIDTSNCTILSGHASDRKRLVATLGVSDLVIVSKEDSQDPCHQRGKREDFKMSEALIEDKKEDHIRLSRKQ